MTEESSLYNPGFLGSGGFHWWVGQISDDSTWRSTPKIKNLMAHQIFLVGDIDIK